MITNTRIEYLFNRYVNGESTLEETKAFFEVVDDPQYKSVLYGLMDAEQHRNVDEPGLDHDQKKRILGHIFQIPDDHQKQVVANRSFPLWPKLLAAAMVLIMISLTIYYPTRIHRQKQVYSTFTGTIQPGGNKAVLTLANGTRVSLSDMSGNQSIREADVRIIKGANGQLIYQDLDESGVHEPATKSVAYNTITTPAGGQYCLVLPDGSHVWINAASSLKFPTTFSSLSERKVELTGEAYFEVAKTRRGGNGFPFIVVSAGQEVKVLGTHFNINSYNDENAVVTTLLEGSVEVSRKEAFRQIISPGEEARVSTGIVVNKIDTSNAVAWKNGVFKFTGADIQTVMNQLSRWYNLEVKYSGKVPSNRFTGEVYRNMDAAKAFQLLTLAHISYRLETPVNHPGRKRIVIMSN